MVTSCTAKRLGDDKFFSEEILKRFNDDKFYSAFCSDKF